MSIIERFLEWLDAPRYCSGCGKAITVVEGDGFDARSGTRRPRWYWCCPEVRVELGAHGSIVRASWWGGQTHVYGSGRPRWHRLEAES